MSQIRAHVDELSEALGRSVAVDDAQLHLLCASAQVGPIDQIRINAIIDRSPPQEPVPWMLGHGIATAREPIRLPANEEHGMLATDFFHHAVPPLVRDILLRNPELQPRPADFKMALDRPATASVPVAEEVAGNVFASV